MSTADPPVAYLRRHWQLGLFSTAVVVAGSYASTIALSRLPADRTLGWPNALSLTLSGVGLLLSVAGFGVTLVQISRTMTAAQAAKDEAQRVRAALKQYDAANDASRASYALHTTKKHFHNNAYLDGAETYEDFRRALLNIRANFPDLSEDDGKRVDDASDYIARLCQRIDRDRDKGVKTVDYVKAKAVIRDHEQLVVHLSAHIHRGAS